MRQILISQPNMTCQGTKAVVMMRQEVSNDTLRAFKKDSDDDARIYDTDGYWLRAACVCVKDSSESEVLLVSSSARPQMWIIPGGKVKPEEEPEMSAAREALEEAGVVGKLGRCLGIFENKERRHRTSVYILTVEQLLEQYDDSNRRKRCWFPIDEAQNHLTSYKPQHCRYLTAMRLPPEKMQNLSGQEEEQKRSSPLA